VNSNLVIPTAILVVIVAAAFVVGRLRVGDWQPRRDALVLGATAVMGVIALLVVLAPPAIALVSIPTTVALAGIYLFANRAPIEDEPSPRRSLFLITAVGAVVMGLFGLVMAVLRLSP
jgi:uncharacterized membrane protein